MVENKAMEAASHTDMCIGKIRDACAKHGVGLFILADHGNAETMLTPDGKPITSHSTSPVPFIAALPADCALKFNRAAGGVADRDKGRFLRRRGCGRQAGSTGAASPSAISLVSHQ